MRVPFISKLFTVVLYLFLLASLAVVVGASVLIIKDFSKFFNLHNIRESFFVFMTFFIWLIGALMAWLMAELIGMMRTLWRNPFTRRNVTALFRLGISVLLLALLFLVKSVMFYTILTVVCTAGLFGAALAVFTLQNLFGQAVTYKEENELTI